MTIEQTVEIPASRRLVIDVPREVPAGRARLTFTLETAADDYVCPICGKTEHIPNAETAAAIREGDAILRGEIPAKRYKSVDEFWNDLDL